MAKAILYSLVGDYGNNLQPFFDDDAAIDAEMTAILADRKTDAITPVNSLVWRAYKYDPAVIDEIDGKSILRGGTITAKVEGDKISRTVTVAATATKIAVTNGNRKSMVITNTSAVTIYLGGDATVTTANGTPLVAGASLSDNASVGEWWAIVAAATADIKVLEFIEAEEESE